MFKAEVFDNGRRITPANDGFLGRSYVNQFVIKITIDESGRERIFPIKVMEPGKHVFELETRPVDQDTTELYYRVPMMKDITRFPSNHIRLVAIKGAEFRIIEVGIVTQDRQYFLVQHETWRGVLYHDPIRETVVCPTFDSGFERSWPEMSFFIKRHLSESQRLPHISGYHQPNGLKVVPAKGKAVVSWFDPISGMGCAQIADGNSGTKAVRIHWSQILLTNGNRFHTVAAGEVVDFQQVEPLAKPSPSFNMQLVGVKRAA